MRLNCWIILMLSTPLLAQPVPDAPPAAPIGTAATDITNPPAATTNAPATTATKKNSTKKKAATKKKEAGAELKTVPLVPGPAVVDAQNVNVRGQPKLK